ncbi:MAG: bacteriohemerythrin, partial [Aquificota bacterium]|nr:bacteriohemerythrin [Aquificota bacterium]
DYESHKKAHDQFRRLMLNMIAKMEEGDDREFGSALARVWGWLYSHILKVDKKYGEFFRSSR